MYQKHAELPREQLDRVLPKQYTQKIIPDVPRLRGIDARIFRAHPLLVYSVFVMVSLVLLGGMAVASLPA